MEPVMKTAILVTTILLGSVLTAQAAPLKTHRHVAQVSSCVAQQRAELAPLDGYGGYPPSFAPAPFQQIMNQALDNMRTRCMPVSTSWQTGLWEQ
jgi:hypothetical protein